MAVYVATAQRRTWSSIIIVTSLTLGAAMIDGELLMTFRLKLLLPQKWHTVFKKVVFAIGHCLKRTQSFVNWLLLKVDQGNMENNY